jgi:hypothetical protein
VRVIQNDADPLSTTGRRLTIALAEDERLEVFAGQQLRVPDVGLCLVVGIRSSKSPMPGLARGERVLDLEVEVL